VLYAPFLCPLLAVLQTVVITKHHQIFSTRFQINAAMNTFFHCVEQGICVLSLFDYNSLILGKNL